MTIEKKAGILYNNLNQAFFKFDFNFLYAKFLITFPDD